MFGKVVNKLVVIKRRAVRPIWRIKYAIWPPRIPKNADGKVYINLGCGNYTSPEFLNIDAVPFKHTHKLGNIEDLSDFPSNSADMIYASHVIEHIPRNDVLKSFKEWHRVLKPGGILRFGVPDFDRLIEIYNASNKKPESIENQLLGQNEGYDDHHTIWNFDYAERMLRKAGFTGEVRRWDADNVDHHSFKDKTNRFAEIGDKRIPISLNVEAFK